MSAEGETHTAVAKDTPDVTNAFSRLSTNDNQDGEAPQRTEEEYAAEQLTLRAIVSSKEAGVIIGKGGKNVADLRDETGVRAGVSKVVPSVHDRVLTVTGGLGGISKAYCIVSKGLLDGAPQMGMGGLINTGGTHREFSQSLDSLQTYHSVLEIDVSNVHRKLEDIFLQLASIKTLALIS